MTFLVFLHIIYRFICSCLGLAFYMLFYLNYPKEKVKWGKSIDLLGNSIATRSNTVTAPEIHQLGIFPDQSFAHAGAPYC